MFNRKYCNKCENRIKKEFNFCPNCGTNLKNDHEREYGFLGKEDINDLKLPFGFNMLLKPLMKELSKQMAELEKESNYEERISNHGKPVKTSFSIHIGTPGSKPIKITPKQTTKKVLELPKFSEEISKKIKNLPKKEPIANVRRLADRVIYELNIPGVESIEDININLLEDAVEIKAISDKELFVKNLDIDLSLIDYFFKKDKMVLEFGLNK